jgi:hypothetical protein
MTPRPIPRAELDEPGEIDTPEEPATEEDPKIRKKSPSLARKRARKNPPTRALRPRATRPKRTNCPRGWCVARTGTESPVSLSKNRAGKTSTRITSWYSVFPKPWASLPTTMRSHFGYRLTRRRKSSSPI